MRVDIRDRNVLASVRPSDVTSYLRSRGWIEDGSPAASSATFIQNDVEIAVPLTTELRDFPLRISDALRTLELIEQRSQTEILLDISLTSDDVIRVRISDVDARDGTLSLERASRVVAKTYDLLLAAACAAIDPKLYYPSRKPQKAMEYMRNIRMGQTEHGSFVVTALSRVSPELMPAHEATALGIPEPFERQVTQRLAHALAAASSAAVDAIATADVAQFEKAVEEGVSANLCESVASLGSFDGQWRNVEIGMSWARSRPMPGTSSTRFLVTADMAQVLHETARLFRSRAPRDDFEVRGPVVRLNRGPEDPIGEVTIAGVIDEETRSVFVTLTGHEYELAVRAHQERLPISVTGVLQKQGRRNTLLSPTSVKLLSLDE
jgi:hypothetical protein